MRHRIHIHDDSRRWDSFVPRADDIVITTPPKSGTTWTQGIVASLLWPRGDCPAPAFDLSPWLDARMTPIADLVARLDTMPHRRVIKTHSPADCVPVHTQCRHIAVYRDPRDAFVSWANHRAKMHPAIIEALNAIAGADGVSPWPPAWNGDLDQLWDEWADWGTPMEHLASWWPYRGEPFVLFVHYADLQRDLTGEMRRIAAFLDVEVPDDLWAEVVGRCSLETMRTTHEASILESAFDGGAGAFFNEGTSGRWRDAMPAHLVARNDELAAAQLPPEADEWIRRGSLALGRRPER